MLCIRNFNTNPYFNLAAEEFVMKNLPDDVFMLWQNEPSIIIGKFQNAMAEVNMDYVRDHNIKVVRRMTGGGAVFHDLGNLNFTFVKRGTASDFRGFTEPILEALQSLGVDASFAGRNDLMIHGQKISGNAECVCDGRVLHHGTLLFSSKMSDLAAALNVNPLKFKDKAVKSVRKRVTNISEHLTSPMSVTAFADYLMSFVTGRMQNVVEYEFSARDLAGIEDLKRSKYDLWDWNFGKSPNYSFSRQARTKGGNLQLCMDLEAARIVRIRFFGDFFSKTDVSLLENRLFGQPHQYEIIDNLLDTINLDEYLLNVTKEDVLSLMF